jgi:1,4-alpha-glucan branching enzyme
MAQGAFTFVLHSHLPYCRQAGRWPHGEEWLHEAISETYLPLLMALDDLHQEGCAFRLTLGITPVLAEQLADGLVLAHLEEFLEEKVHRAEADIGRFQQEGDDHRAYLGGY